MRVLVCGGRDFDDRDLMAATLAKYKPVPLISGVSDCILILGAAPGADKMAQEWAEVFGVRMRIYPAGWAEFGRAAGPIRNQRMIDDGKPELVIAFPGGKGTSDMVRRAKKAGIEVIEIKGRGK